MKSVGIVGFGSFGKFVAENLDEQCKVLVYSKSGKTPNKWTSTITEVAKCDYLILSIPLSAYQPTLKLLKPHLNKNTIIVDVCSVKQKPLQIIKTVLPNQPLVATHPLFGPGSAQESLSGHTLVLCPDDSDTTAMQTVKDFATNLLQLRVVEKSAEQHDKEMARVHGLTFFISHILKDFDLQSNDLDTPSYKRLLGLAELEKHHSDELFNTIQSGNKHTQHLRQQFIDAAVELDSKISTGL